MTRSLKECLNKINIIKKEVLSEATVDNSDQLLAFVVMCDDFPREVFLNEDRAETRCKELKNTFTKSEWTVKTAHFRK